MKNSYGETLKNLNDFFAKGVGTLPSSSKELRLRSPSSNRSKKVSKMPHAAVHKKNQKKRRGAEAALNEYTRRLQAIDEDDEVPIGRITKMLRADRFMVTIYDTKKKHIVEVQAAVVDRNVLRLKPDLGSFVVVAQSGKTHEIFLVLSDADANARPERIHKSILHYSVTSGAPDEDVGIEFDYEGLEEEKDVAEDKKDKKDKVGKHVERVLRAEGDEVDVDNI